MMLVTCPAFIFPWNTIHLPVRSALLPHPEDNAISLHTWFETRHRSDGTPPISSRSLLLQSQLSFPKTLHDTRMDWTGLTSSGSVL